MKQCIYLVKNATASMKITGLLFFVVASMTFSQITITENSPERFSFDWNISGCDTFTINKNGTLYTSLSFRGSNITTEQPRKPILPGFALLVGVPAQGSVSTSFIPTSTTTITLTHPIARFDYPTTDSAPYNITPDESWISVGEYTRLRSLRTASIILKPLRYNAENQTVTLVTRASCTITFPQAAHRFTKSPIKSDYDKTVSRMLANYDVAQGWRSSPKIAKRQMLDAYPLSSGKKCFYFKVGDGQSGFNEATINENGIMKLQGAKIRDRFGATNIANVKVYASVKGMLPDTLPADGSIPNGISECPLIRIDNNGNGELDDDDYLLVYVTGASDWVGLQDNQFAHDNFALDVYDNYRTYWVTIGNDSGNTMKMMPPCNSEPEITKNTFTIRRRFKQSKFREYNDRNTRNWLWTTISKGQKTFEFSPDLPGIDPGIDKEQPGKLIPGSVCLNFGAASIAIGSAIIDSSDSFSNEIDIDNWDDFTLRLENMGKTDSSIIEIRYIDITYQRKLEIDDRPAILSLLSSNNDSGEIIAYHLKIVTDQTIYILRVPGNDRQTELVASLHGMNGETYEWIDSSFSGRRYIVCNEASLFDTPDLIEPDAPLTGTHLVTNLRSESNHTDYLIITHPEFLAAADSLARHKKKIGFANPVVVNIFDIYRYFSGGNKDAGAIRNFIGYVSRYWKNDLSADYVLLVGVGHYDSKNYITTATDFIPTYITSEYCYENYFTLVAPYNQSDAGAPQIAIGRLPCLTNDHAWAMVNKIVQAEDPAVADFGEWRNRMLFVADDDMQGTIPDPVVASRPHYISSDITANVADSLMPSLDIRKVYLYEYEWDQKLQKPGASIALINEFNNGIGYINFFGHGADITWTDEYILTADMVARMNNKERYPVVAAFSCAVGRFDQPNTESLSGVLVRSAGVGAIAAISSTREAYAHTNENLAINFYGFLFDTLSGNSIGTSLIAAQMKISSSSNRTYCILGDPSFRAIRPTHRVTLAIDDENDTLEALQHVTISGSIEKLSGGGTDKSFGGSGASVAIGLFNAADSTTRKDGGTNYVSYPLPGTPLFLGRTAINDGTFKQTVLIPQNCSFDKKGVKLIAYAWKNNAATCATGYKNGIIFHGSKSIDDISDREGPVITIRPSYDDDNLSGGTASFSDHITVQVPATCEIELVDSSGIDAAGIGPDEGITLEIEGIVERQNINSKFQFKEGDFRRGIVSVVYDETVLKPGSYTMNVTGRDLLGNLSKAKFTLNVTSEDELNLDHVFNFPNPVRYGKVTRFYCHTSYTAQTYWNATSRLIVKIYTLSGKLLRVIKNARNGQQWDCRDERGHLLSPDIYLYQITMEDTKNKKTKKSKIMKLVILPPK